MILFYQNVTPPPLPPLNQPAFFCLTCTGGPGLPPAEAFMAASWAALGATPGGGGGIDGGAYDENLAPESKWPGSMGPGTTWVMGACLG